MHAQVNWVWSFIIGYSIMFELYTVYSYWYTVVTWPSDGGCDSTSPVC